METSTFLPASAVALLSSGLDSSVAMAMHLFAGGTVKLAVTIDYGQRARRAEISHAAQIAAHFGVPHQVVSLPWMASFPSGLTSTDRNLPAPSTAQLDEMAFAAQSAKAVWVPNRNGILIEVAAGYAESLGASQVLVGFNREEAATFPDNSVDYLQAMNQSLSYSTSNQVQVVSPTALLDKREMVAWARRTEFPLALLWSCYEAAQQMCGKCESCKRLLRALSHEDFSYWPAEKRPTFASASQQMTTGSPAGNTL